MLPFSTVYMHIQCLNFRNGSPTTKLLHQMMPVFVGQKTVLPKQNRLLTNKHRGWLDDCWSEDRSPHNHHHHHHHHHHHNHHHHHHHHHLHHRFYLYLYLYKYYLYLHLYNQIVFIFVFVLVFVFIFVGQTWRCIATVVCRDSNANVVLSIDLTPHTLGNSNYLKLETNWLEI